MSLGLHFIDLSFGVYRSEDDFNHSVGDGIERVIRLAQNQEKVIALKTAQLMSTFEVNDQRTITGCFNLSLVRAVADRKEARRSRCSSAAGHGPTTSAEKNKEGDRQNQSY